MTFVWIMFDTIISSTAPGDRNVTFIFRDLSCVIYLLYFRFVNLVRSSIKSLCPVLLHCMTGIWHFPALLTPINCLLIVLIYKKLSYSKCANLCCFTLGHIFLLTWLGWMFLQFCCGFNYALSAKLFMFKTGKKPLFSLQMLPLIYATATPLQRTKRLSVCARQQEFFLLGFNVNGCGFLLFLPFALSINRVLIIMPASPVSLLTHSSIFIL